MSDLLTKCEVCHALLDEEDLFCANCGTEAPHAAQTAAQATQLSTHNFQCQSCGASMSYDPSAGTLRCPFCGSSNLQGQEDAKTTSPSKIVPFAIGKKDAIEKMRRWLGKGFWRPGDLSQQAMVVSMTPVYVPYWSFHANTDTYWTADSSQTPPGSRSGWFPMTGEYHGSYSGVLVGASGALSSAETSAIIPFDLSKAVAPRRIRMDNVTVEQFSVARKYARPLARRGLEQLEAQACQQLVPGRCRNIAVNVRITDLHSEPILLPVWIMAYRYRDQVFRFVANGQNGRATGRAPTSYRKIAAAIGIGLAVLLVILLLASLRR